jgi:hypothetical protein
MIQVSQRNRILAMESSGMRRRYTKTPAAIMCPDLLSFFSKRLDRID